MSAPSLRELGQALPVRSPKQGEIDALRESLLDEARSTPQRRGIRRGWWAGGAALAAGVVAAVAWSWYPPASSAPVPRAAVVAYGAADFARSTEPLANGVTRETVQLRIGRVRIAAHRAQQVRIVVADAEVEVAGAVLQVLAASDGLQEVVVEEGSARLRVRGGAAIVLEQGDTWKRPVAPQPEPPPQTVTVTPAPQHRVAVAPVPPPTGDAAESAFAAGWEALRSGDPVTAAASFHAAQSNPTAALREDAQFWEGVALERAGRGDEAEGVMTSFLAHSPHATRAGELSVMLGWLLLDRGEWKGAQARFEAGAADLDARVQDGARAGLKQVEMQSKRALFVQ
jgi:TolA-binding protein